MTKNNPTVIEDDLFQVDWTIHHSLSQLENTGINEILPEYRDRLYDLSNKLAQEQLKKGEAITSPDHSRKAVRELLYQKQEEVMAVLFLDSKHRIIQFDELFPWSINSAMIYTRVLIKETLSHNASAIILVHNHPSGNCEPSRQDIHITERIKSWLDLIEVRLLDHLVVGVEWIYSFAEKGKLGL